MAGMGPPPKPAGTRARRNPTIATTKLPSEGRQGDVPTWPLPDDIVMAVTGDRLAVKIDELREQLESCAPRQQASLERKLEQAVREASVLDRQMTAQLEMESAFWVELWSTPQAAQWEALGWFRDVAQYVRHKVRAELGSLDDAKEARQWSDRLGLNPLAMLRLRWETERTEEAEDRGRKRRSAPPAPSKRRASDPRSVLRAV